MIDQLIKQIESNNARTNKITLETYEYIILSLTITFYTSK